MLITTTTIGTVRSFISFPLFFVLTAYRESKASRLVVDRAKLHVPSSSVVLQFKGITTQFVLINVADFFVLILSEFDDSQSNLTTNIGPRRGSSNRRSPGVVYRTLLAEVTDCEDRRNYSALSTRQERTRSWVVTE